MSLVILLSAILFFLFLSKGNFDNVSRHFLEPYAFVWFFALFLSTQGILGLSIPKNSTLILLILHLFTFLIGFKMVPINNAFIVNHNHLQNSVDRLLDNRFFHIILVVCLVYVLSLFTIFYRAVVVMQSLSDVRSDFYEGDLYGPLYSMINMFILTPFDYVLFPLFGYLSVKRRNWQWFLIMVYLIVHSSLAGGRLGYIRIVLGIIFFVYCLANTNGNINRLKQFVIMGTVAVVTYCLIIITSAGRTGYTDVSSSSLEIGQEVANEHITTYTSGPISAFDYALENHYEKLVDGYKYGGLIFTTIEGLCYTILGKIGIAYERPITPVVELLQTQRIDIGVSYHWNALYTSCIYYYLDFGIIGVIIIPFFIGILFRRVIKKFYDNNNVYGFILLAYIFLKLLFSIIQFNFTNYSELLFVCFLLYMSNRTNKELII